MLMVSSSIVNATIITGYICVICVAVLNII